MTNDYSNKWLAFIGIALLSFGCYLDYTVVNVALPTIQKELQANLIQLQWIMNIYFLVLCILATIMGRCGDLYGRRRVFYIGVNIFAIASLIAGFSANIAWLIFGRFLQGTGAAIVFPLGPSLLPEAFPEKERGKAIAWLGSLGGVALALGPMLGGANRSSVATGTMVTMFNVGGSIGLAIAVVVYHSAGMSHLKYLLKMHTQQLSSDQFLKLKGLISNPAQSLKVQMSTLIHSIFNDSFMRGFSGVMWFLFGLSILMLLSVLIFKISKHKSLE